MKARKPRTLSIDWTKTRTHTSLVLLATLITASAAGLTALRHWYPETVSKNGKDQRPDVIAEDGGQHTICKEWTSVTSGKHYNFICSGANLFEVYEVTNNGPNKVGTGRIDAYGRVEAELLVQPGNREAPKRRARLSLTLTSDGKKMEGPWHGDDPREFGQLNFSVVE